jgi:hypothetical protein
MRTEILPFFAAPLLAVTVALSSPGLAQAPATPPAAAGADGATVPPLKAEELTPEEKAEREARKDCKVRICSAFHNRKPEGGDVTCSVLKSWRKDSLDKMLSKAKVSWPWGRVKCTADVRLKRDMLIKALTEPHLEAQLDMHKVVCEVERTEGGPADIKFEFTPKVTFEQGKAVKAVLGWGKIEAPTLVKGAMWTVTATDNTFNVLQSTIVDDINQFIGPRCDEVKSEWTGK